MGTLNMTDNTIEPETIDWKSIDTDERASAYESKTPYVILPGIIYHFIGPPINMLLPSTQNLSQYRSEGVYFNENYFLEVTLDDDNNEYIGEFFYPKIGDMSQVSYCPKFISTRYLIDNYYFGNRFTNNNQYVKFNRNYNLNQRTNEKFEVDWLEEHVTLINKDEYREKSLHGNVPLSKRISKDMKSFNDQTLKDIDNEDSQVYSLVSGQTDIPDDVTVMLERWQENKGKGKGKGKGPSKGKGKEGKSTDGLKGYPNKTPTIDSKIANIVKNPCYIIEDENIYKITEDHNIEKLSLTSKIPTSELISELSLLKQIISSKIANLKGEPLRIELNKDDKKKKTPKAQPKVVPKRKPKVKPTVVSDDEETDD